MTAEEKKELEIVIANGIMRGFVLVLLAAGIGTAFGAITIGIIRWLP